MSGLRSRCLPRKSPSVSRSLRREQGHPLHHPSAALQPGPSPGNPVPWPRPLPAGFRYARRIAGHIGVVSGSGNSVEASNPGSTTSSQQAGEEAGRCLSSEVVSHGPARRRSCVSGEEIRALLPDVTWWGTEDGFPSCSLQFSISGKRSVDMNDKTQSCPRAFLRSLGSAVVLVAAVTGASPAQAQTQEQMEEWLVPINEAFGVFAGQWAELSIYRLISPRDDQLESMMGTMIGATCGLTEGEGSRAVEGMISSIEPDELRDLLFSDPEHSLYGVDYANFLESEEIIIRERGYPEMVQASYLNIVATYHWLVRWSRIGALWDSLFSEFSTSKVRDAIRSLCDASSGSGERSVGGLRRVWNTAQILGGLFLEGVNRTYLPEGSIGRKMSFALGRMILALGVKDIQDQRSE